MVEEVWQTGCWSRKMRNYTFIPSTANTKQRDAAGSGVRLSLLEDYFQQGSVSSRFCNLSEQQHHLGTKCSNTEKPRGTFLTETTSPREGEGPSLNLPRTCCFAISDSQQTLCIDMETRGQLWLFSLLLSTLFFWDRVLYQAQSFLFWVDQMASET